MAWSGARAVPDFAAMPTQAPPRPDTITIPAAMLPSDGRFGCGPSKFRPEAAEALADRAVDYLGTSHRRAGVRAVVADLRAGIAELLGAPDGYEVVLGNGGATAFWDAASFGLIERRSHHLSLGEFSSKFVAVTTPQPPISRIPRFGWATSGRARRWSLLTGWTPTATPTTRPQLG